MGLVNAIFKWLISERENDIENFSSEPINCQREVFDNLHDKLINTQWGKKWSISKLPSYEDFNRKIPVVSYEDIQPEIDKMMKGEANILYPGTINWYAKSSGTTNSVSKFIPVSKESLNDCHFKAGKDMYATYCKLNPNTEIASGKTLVLGGSHNVYDYNNTSKYGDLSAVLMQNLPFWAELRRVPSLEIALMDNWEIKLDKMAEATIKSNVTNIMGVPSWTLMLFKKIVEITGEENILNIWRNLELYVHGGVSFEPYKNIFNEYIKGKSINYLETYNASEGYFAFQDRFNVDDLLLLTDHGIFYEFIPAKDAINGIYDSIVPLENVDLHTNYALVISTNAGLWRYLIGDTIVFTSRNPYRIKITGRTKHYINTFGEELMVDNAEKAISICSQKFNIKINEFTAAPKVFEHEKNVGVHQWLIEFDAIPKDLENFAEELDAQLRALNSDYDAKRKGDLALKRLEIFPMPKGVFYAWMKQRNRLGGQHKVPRLNNTREYVDELLKLSREV